MYTCTCICLFVRMYVRMVVCCLFVSVYICVCVWAYVHIMFVCLYARTYVSVCMYECTYVPKYVCMHVCLFVCLFRTHKQEMKLNGINRVTRSEDWTDLQTGCVSGVHCVQLPFADIYGPLSIFWMTDHTPTKLAQEITFLLCVLEVPNSIFGQHTNHPEVLRGFRHSSFKYQLRLSIPSYPWLVHGGSFISFQFTVR